MDWGNAVTDTRTLDDGLGVRRLDSLDQRQVEVLNVAPALAQLTGFEAAVRARAARCGELSLDNVATVKRIDREGAALRIVADHVDGLRLPDLLREAHKSNPSLTLPAALELASQIVSAVATLHRKPGFAHGAISPAHIVVTRQAKIVLTDCAFGDALETLHRNREQLWREFRVAMPSSASLPRFDVRSDVTQLGATVLSIMLGRPLTADEYPKCVSDLVNDATVDAAPGQPDSGPSRLRMWLYRGLQLHPRENFGSAVAAERAFNDMLGALGNRRAGVVALQSLVRSIHGEPAPTATLIVPPLAAPDGTLTSSGGGSGTALR